MSVRRRLLALAVVVVLVLGAFIIVLVRTRTPDCGVSVQRPVLAPALRALGDFDQAYDAGQPPVLEDAAERAASAQYPNLIGTTPEQPVVVAGTGSLPDVLVVPLRGPASSTTQPTPAIVGLVAFARDCQGNAYFQVVENDVNLQPAMSQFPPVSRATAAAQLGSSLRLQYANSPLRPEWASTTSPATVLPAR